MCTTRRIIVSGLLAAVTLVAAVGSAAAQPAGTPRSPAPGHVVAVGGLDFYESPTFGYVEAWPPGSWRVQTDQSAGGVDTLILTGAADGIAGQAEAVAFEGFAGYGGDPAACLAAAAARWAHASGVARFRPAVLQFDTGQAVDPALYRINSPTRATGVYTLALTGGQGQATTSVLQLDCRRLVPGSAVLLVADLTTLARFTSDLLSWWWVALPRRSFSRDASGQLSGASDVGRCEGPANGPQLMVSPAGDEVGMATVVDPRSWLVLIEDTGTHPLDVGHLPLVFQPSGSGAPPLAPVARTVFDLPSARSSGTRLEPGQRALVLLEFYPLVGGMGSLLYAPQSGHAVEIGSLGGGCAGGFRPRIVTGT